MGLITGLLTLPLAPLRGTVWLAERIQEQAEEELYDESAIRAGLLELESARQAGTLDEDELYDESAIRAGLLELESARQVGTLDEQEIAAAEDALIERLMAIRGLAGEERDGGFE